jgi:hypothetical protein
VNWIIVSCNYGRLGNRLHTHANILAWCILNNYSLSNLSFRSYSNFFERQSNNSSDYYFQTKNFLFYLMKNNFIANLFERLILSKKWIRRLSLFLHHVEKDNFSTLEEHELDVIKTNKIIIINTWDIRCPNSLKIAGQTVKNLLQPASLYLQKANSFITHLKKSYNCLVGIHARRGDYENYLEGQHFHSWETYQNWILELKNVLESKGYNKIGFILCSDESPPPLIFNNSFIHFTESNHFMHDLHTLALCDYNIGPPSSFGTWISWYGNVPRLIINKDTKIDNLETFRISNSC